MRKDYYERCCHSQSNSANEDPIPPPASALESFGLSQPGLQRRDHHGILFHDHESLLGNKFPRIKENHCSIFSNQDDVCVSVFYCFTSLELRTRLFLADSFVICQNTDIIWNFMVKNGKPGQDQKASFLTVFHTGTMMRPAPPARLSLPLAASNRGGICWQKSWLCLGMLAKTSLQPVISVLFPQHQV